MADYRYGKSVSNVPDASNPTINTLLCGIKWETSSVGTAINLTYSFPWTTNSEASWGTHYSYYSYTEEEPYAYEHYGLSAEQIIAAISAMQAWANVANITFTQLAESGSIVGDIRFAFSSAVEDAWGWSYLPSSYPEAADIWINPNLENPDNYDFSAGGYGYNALIHELGHALGLKHPGYYGAGDEAPYLSSDKDSQLYSIMSYNDAYNRTSYRYAWDDTENTEYYVSVNAQTPMVYDILAMQYLYGANMSYHNTDDMYLFDENTAPFLMTIWDGGGNDTISVEGSINSNTINLNEGAYSVIQTSRFRGYDTYLKKYVDNMSNLGIAYGAIIENAIGGEANDKITGNQVDNVLEGRGGNDILNGGLGNDILIGGLGNDTLDGGLGIDTVTYESSTVGVTVNLALTTAQIIQDTEKDTIKNIENLTGSNYNDILKGSTLSNNINGLDGDDKIIAGTGKTNDILDGGDGIDTISYEQATSFVTIDLSNTSSQITMGSGSDTLTNFENLTGSKYNDILTGSIENNTIIGGAGNDTINGGAGNDTIDGGVGNDILNGGDGSDTLSYETATAAIKVSLSSTLAQATGGSGSDTIFNFENIIGSKYNDTLIGNDGDNTIDGGVGNDIIEGGLGDDTLIGGDGIDTLSYATASSSVSVDLSNEDAQNTAGAGTDTITGFENITGSNYDDTLKGNILNNIILAGLGNDILIGGLGNDTLDGGLGIDTVTYESSTVGVTVNLALTTAQTIQGTEKDTIKNIENLTGSNYNDILKGSTLSNNINGLDGDDKIIAGTGKTNDILDGGDGIDTISYEQATSFVTIDLSNTSSQITMGSGSDTLTNFENLTGSKYNDILIGDSNDNIIIGGAGNDTINGGAGNDTIDGGVGNDILNGGDGSDTLSYETATAAIKVSLSSTLAQATGGSGSDTISNFENLTGSKHNDTLTGNDNNNTINGGIGNDIIEGGLGNDTLIGGIGIDTLSYATASSSVSVDLSNEDAQNTVSAGTDTITGFENITGSNYDDTLKGNILNNIILAGLGNDILIGGLGNDTLDGGLGIDTVTYESSTVGVTVNLALTTAQTIQGTEKDTIKNIENLTGSNYNDILKGSTLSNNINGLDGDDKIIAGTGKTNDILDGGDGIDTISYEQATSFVTIDLSNTSSQITMGSGSDTLTNFENLTGSKYNDILIGDSNDNIIIGGAGNDTINGGAGNDTIDGGVGNDVFIFDQELNLDNIDTILNFSSVYDTIQIDNAIFDVFTNFGTILQDNFYSSINGSALDANDYILYNTTTGELSYDSDGNGSNAALVFAVLNNGTTHPIVSYNDFVII